MKQQTHLKPTSSFLGRKIATFGVLILGLSSMGLSKLPEDARKKIRESLQPSRHALLQPFKNWGLLNGTAKSHIDAPLAWKIEQGSRDVVVAIIDTGLDAHHPDLASNVWKEGKEGRGNRTAYGWDYVTNRSNPIDDHGHGTHIAGIIGAAANNKSGVSGVAHNVSIMAVKYYSDANPGAINLANTVRAINYAVDHGARIINYSGGGPQRSDAEYLAIKKAEAHGVLIVAAAGNDASDTDVEGSFYYPAAYGAYPDRLTNIITVAATDINNNLLTSSNWGKLHVDVAAPGDNIYSTLPGGRYGYMSGTSQATAFVTGIAALLLSKNPKLTPQEVKKLILASVDPIASLKDKIATGGRVNAYSALMALTNQARPGMASREPVSVAAPAPSLGVSAY